MFSFYLNEQLRNSGVRFYEKVEEISSENCQKKQKKWSKTQEIKS